MKTKLSDIKIMKTFKRTSPSPEKLLTCMTHYAKYRKLDRDIVLTKDNVLVDGYVGYLTLVGVGAKKWKCIRDNSYQWYVQGKHPYNEKVYTWKLPDQMIVNGLPSIFKGKKYRIKTSNGECNVKIINTFISNKPPIDGAIFNFTLV